MSSCKGCIYSGFCDVQMLGTTYGCPCGNCIVKSMCNNNICKEFNDYYKDRFGFDDEEYTK
jgi:hypothetical protein